AEAESRPTQTVQVDGAVQVVSASSESAAPPPVRSTAPVPAPRSPLIAAAAAAVPPSQPKSDSKSEPAPFTNGVIQTQPIAAIPGSAEPMKPVKVKTVQIKAGQTKLASAGPPQPPPPITNAIPSARAEVPETSSALVAKADITKPESS